MNELKPSEDSVRHERLLYFFKMHRLDQPELEALELTPDRLIDALDRLEDRAQLLPRTRNRLSYIYVGVTEDGIHKLVLTTMRRFWSKVQAGNEIKDLKLKEGEDLAETAHLCIFPDGYLGIEFNQNGPKMSQFELLVNSKFGDELGVIGFLRCVRRTTLESVQKNQVYRKVGLRIWNSDVSAVGDNLRDHLIGAMQAMDTDSIEIIFRDPRNEKSNWTKRAKELIAGLVGYKVTDEKDKFRKPKVKVEAIDEHGTDYAFSLVSSEISMRRTISFEDDEESKYINSDRWFETIIKEKSSLQPVLDEAVYAKLGELDD